MGTDITSEIQSSGNIIRTEVIKRTRSSVDGSELDVAYHEAIEVYFVLGKYTWGRSSCK